MPKAVIDKPTTSRKRTTTGTQIRTYRSAVNYLDSLVNYERMVRPRYGEDNYNLARMARLLSALGNPHRQLKTVHIAGTKGKGSTATMLAEMVRACGVKTGLYTSPHVVNVRERIVVDGKMVSEREFARTVAAVAAITEKARVGQPTYFEVLTAAAFQYFAKAEVDLAVIETGMGGRLDCTNVVHPEVVGITTIGHDHLDQLGDSLPLIAQEKAGVFKAGVPVVSAAQRQSVKETLRKAATELEVPLRFADEDFEFSYRFEHSRSLGSPRPHLPDDPEQPVRALARAPCWASTRR